MKRYVKDLFQVIEGRGWYFIFAVRPFASQGEYWVPFGVMSKMVHTLGSSSQKAFEPYA
jgi:hypothetical protein